MNVWKSWAESKGLNDDIVKYEAKKLDECLTRFFPEIHKSDGSNYERVYVSERNDFSENGKIQGEFNSEEMHVLFTNIRKMPVINKQLSVKSVLTFFRTKLHLSIS